MTYWDDRAKEIIKDETLSDKEMSLEIERIINNMINDIENEISKFYARYADSEGISISEAKRKLITSMFNLSLIKLENMYKITTLVREQIEN